MRDRVACRTTEGWRPVAGTRYEPGGGRAVDVVAHDADVVAVAGTPRELGETQAARVALSVPVALGGVESAFVTGFVMSVVDLG